MLRILETKPLAAQKVMDLDAELLELLAIEKTPLLHLYEWEGPCATYGYFIDPARHLDLSAANERCVALARRPTGGGIVMHIWDLAFSFLMPAEHPLFSHNTLDNYRFVNQIVLQAITNEFPLDGSAELTPVSALDLGSDCQHFCMAKPTQYDVVYEGRKIAGAAQRKRKQGYLHQGTISLAFPDVELLFAILRSKQEVLDAIQAHTFAPLGSSPSEETLKHARTSLRRSLIHCFKNNLG